jgi:hypothetical protein
LGTQSAKGKISPSFNSPLCTTNSALKPLHTLRIRSAIFLQDRPAHSFIHDFLAGSADADAKAHNGAAVNAGDSVNGADAAAL